MQVSLGPPILTINHGDTFMVTDLAGQIQSEGYLGIFSNDTRYLSYYACYIDGHSWNRVTSATPKYYASQIYLTNPTFSAKNRAVKAGEISLIISRFVGQGIHEELQLTNYSLATISFNLEIALRSDFADIFEIESGQFVRRGRIETQWDINKRELSTTYTNKDFYRRLIYQISHCSTAVHSANGRITFEVTLEPSETWCTFNNYALANKEQVHEVSDYRYEDIVNSSPSNTVTERLQDRWCRSVTAVSCPNQTVEQVYRRSVSDLGALRLFNGDDGSDLWIAAAGIPKFVTLFGRDSLITSLQTMMVHPSFALGALQQLAKHQAAEYSDWHDAEPGKIMHEVRQGELAKFNQVPHTPYYGTADATPLFLITLHETWKWLGDDSLLKEHRDVILGCLEWLDHYGDLDGDGFQEYKRRSSKGIKNQGWKDSDDAIVYPDGSQVQSPTALCELQGYAFDAWMRMAEVFEHLGEQAQANSLRTKAGSLQTQFEKNFWCEELGFYALTLDLEKQPAYTISSNVGHCLWSGLIRPDRAARVAQRLLQKEMWSGWGIRTLSTDNPGYNPFSYHCGSIWPHDNGIIAMGLKRYGFTKEVERVAQGILEAAGSFENFRLPELYAGIDRKPGSFPVPYSDANVPQAWAAASVFQLLQAMLGLRADAPNRRFYIDPDLPDWLPEITLRRIQVGSAQIDIKFWRNGEHTYWDVTTNTSTIEVIQEAWQPWQLLN